MDTCMQGRKEINRSINSQVEVVERAHTESSCLCIMRDPPPHSHKSIIQKALKTSVFHHSFGSSIWHKPNRFGGKTWFGTIYILYLSLLVWISLYIIAAKLKRLITGCCLRPHGSIFPFQDAKILNLVIHLVPRDYGPCHQQRLLGLPSHAHKVPSPQGRIQVLWDLKLI